MSKYDPLTLMGNPNEPNRWLHMVPKVHRFQCEICRWPAPSYRVLKEHKLILHEFPKIRLISPIRDSPSTSPVNEISSTIVVPPSVNPNVTSKVDRVHIESKVNTDGQSRINPNLKCQKCNLTFKRRENLNNHITRSCPNNPNSEYCKKKKTGIKCNLCEKLFSNQSNLKQHVRNKHSK